MSSSTAAPPSQTAAVSATSLPEQAATNPGFWAQVVKHRISYILIPFLVFVVFPILASAVLSMTEYKGTTPPQFTGLGNFRQLLSLDVETLPQAVDKASGELLFKCGDDQVPQSKVDALKASGVACTVAFMRPSEVLPRGFQVLTRFEAFGKTIVVGASDYRFWISVWNTLRYALIVVPFGIILGLALALALQRQNVLNYILRTIFFLPSVTSTLAVVTIWKYVFNSEDYGLVNALFAHLGLHKVTFLADAAWTLPVMIIFALWGGMGYNMILFLAGLQNISAELYEAAAIDGASPWQRIWGITIPLLRPTLLYVLVTGTISAFQVFEIVYVLFSTTEHVGGVLDSGLMVVPYLYNQGFRLFQLGYASSIAWILFMIIFVLTLINLRIGRANEAY
jgi:multiple sugar transport system permease protein